MALWDEIDAAIGTATGRAFRALARRNLGGGCINGACLLEDGKQRFFVKTNRAERHAMFVAEAAALAEIAASASVRVPAPLCHGIAADHAYLVLEYLELGSGSSRAAALLGEQLAALHQTTAAQFGWHMDNAIGATPQPNAWTRDWLEFYGERRLRFQLQLAAGRARHLLEKGERLIERLAQFFDGYAPRPALLHGDLWGGNWAALADDTPVVFDPASYYGDREADLAMTELFGGFPQRFYAAYQAALPLDAGYATRKTLYNLYHVLNHFNLFGGGYGGQAERMMDHLLATVR